LKIREIKKISDEGVKFPNIYKKVSYRPGMKK
jgi:hypothetical protein